MPFEQRFVEPRRVSRLTARNVPTPAEEAGKRKLRRPVLFSSLDEVSCHTLTSIIYQLSDLSRHASDIFLGLEMEAGMVYRRSCRIQGRLQVLQGEVRKLDPKKVQIPVSNLDEESKWTVHYTAPWHQQENVFLPGNRPPCVEDLHRQAKVNLKSALRECDKLRKDGFRSSQYYSQGPTFSDPLQSGSLLDEDEDDKKSLASSAEDDKSQLSMRSQSLLGTDKLDAAEVDGKVVWTKATPLPTPEEKMRQTAQAVPTDIVAINVTGAVFDRQASFRRSLINTDTVSRRPKKVKRRKTISGLPDNFHQELAAKGRGGELRPHSMFIPGQYSTLGRVGSVNSMLRRSHTRDSSCQTEDVKVVPPSMRRIRAQRGQGIAAQMAGISTSSSTGSISISSTDSSGILMMPHQFNGDPSRFHSLPRQGARVSLSADPLYSSTPIKCEEQNTPHRQIGKLQVDETAVHMRNAPRTSTLPRPKSQEVRATQSSDWGGGPARLVSPHASYSTSIIPNATISSSSEVITLNTSHSPSAAYPAVPRPLSLACATPQKLSSPVAFSHSSTCPDLITSTPNSAPQMGGKMAAAPAGSSRDSDSSMHSHSTLAPTPPSYIPEEQWLYDTPENVVAPHRPLTSSCSTPINQLYSSLDQSSRTTTDSSSLYSQDNDGYYTSMHLDSGLRSRCHNSGLGAAAGRPTRHSMYECREMANSEDTGSLYSDHSLSRSISLRKSKKPPLPPARTDSLRRKSGSKKPLGGVSAISGSNESNGAMLNETLIASLQQSLQIGLRGGKGKGASPSSPSHSPSSDYDDPWVLRPRSHSSISAGSSAASLVANSNSMSNAYSLCHVTPTQSETSSLRSDYADSWGYYMDYPRNNGDPRAHTPLASTSDNMLAVSQLGEPQNGGEIQTDDQRSGVTVQDRGGAVKPKTTSPDRVHRLTSPSSGYSSQSNTPTAGTPVPSIARSMSPSGGRPKPKVPERKSSLISSLSVSSSSTSLSSNTSDSLKSTGPPPPPPAPPILLSSSSSAPNTPMSQPPSFPPPVPPSNTPPHSTLCPPPPCSTSPEFPPPPSPDALIHTSVSFNGSFSPPPPPPPLPSLASPPPPPPLPDCVPLPSFTRPAVKPVKDAPANSPTMSTKPLITPFALQSVQLRSVKRQEAEVGKMNDKMLTELSQGLRPQAVDIFVYQNQLQSSNHCPEDSRTSTPSPVSNLIEELGRPSNSTDCNGKVTKEDYLFSNAKELLRSPQSSPVKIPPAVSKKPNLPVTLTCSTPEPVSSQIADTYDGPRPEDRFDAPTVSVKEEALEKQEAGDSTKETSESQAEVRKTPSEVPNHGQNSQDHKELCTNGEVHEETDEDVEESSTSGSTTSKEEDPGDVFEPGTAESAPAPRENMVTPTPTRTRTTEDLFAVIHRSKRKVLGRRESEEEKCRSQSQSPPVTPTSAPPSVASSLPRQTGSIQRNLRKSSTSSDTFKALLLKKGSRSETSFRMSAAEMLRSTDPRFQRTRSESALDPVNGSPSSPGSPQSPCSSPGRAKRSLDEWSRYEALALSSPTSPSYSLSGMKYGRSRTPPSAASSKYNSRCRLLSSPMTVICEREGETAESEYGDAGLEVQGLPVLQDSDGTLSEQSRS